MKLTVLHNPEAGDGSWSRRRVKDMLRELGHDAHIIESKKGWRKELDDDPDAYVAVGGDGTVHKLMRTVDGRGVPVAIMPTGTANNVAHALGYVAGHDLMRRAAQWQRNERVLSLARVQVDDGKQRSFVEALGAGAFVAMRQESKAGQVRSAPADVLTAVRRALVRNVVRVEPVHIRAQVDGTSHQGDFVLFECLNLPFFGPRVCLARSARSHNAALIVVGVRAEQRDALSALINDGAGDAEPFVIARGKRITLQTEAATHVDGKIWPKRGSERLEISGGSGKLRVWV